MKNQNIWQNLTSWPLRLAGLHDESAQKFEFWLTFWSHGPMGIHQKFHWIDLNSRIRIISNVFRFLLYSNPMSLVQINENPHFFFLSWPTKKYFLIKLPTWRETGLFVTEQIIIRDVQVNTVKNEIMLLDWTKYSKLFF